MRCGESSRLTLLSGASGERRVWRCGVCRAQFSVLAGTILERTRVPLPAWIAVLADVVCGPVAARELARRRGLTPATARLLRARLVAAGVRPGDPPAAALALVLRLSEDEVARVRRAVPGRRDLADGPSASLG